MRLLIAAILAFVALNELNAHDPVGYREPDSIFQTIVCNIPDPDQQYVNETEEIRPVIHLIPAAQEDYWRPPPSQVPLYVENSTLLETDTELQRTLIDHLIRSEFNIYDGNLFNLGPKPDVQQDAFLPPGCQRDTIPADVINNAPNPFVMEYLRLLACSTIHNFVEVSPDYFPPYFALTKCSNNIVAPTCSVPPGASCAINVTCNVNVPMLHWDCCWSWSSDAGYQYECGWRRVLVPFPTECLCTC